MSSCKHCKAPIKWVTMSSGKMMPLDEKPLSVVWVKENIGEVIQAYMPHWATCPGADQFRKKQDGK